jgi:transcriptional regulator with XRE-family HTH domain
VSVTASAPPGIGHLLRYWRAVRAKSQLDLACDAETTPRYVSFVETGRAQPSRQMVVRLARALDVPLRERNELLLAAGYAPLYSSAPLSSPLLKRVEQALTSMLDQHEPFPAVVLDRGLKPIAVLELKLTGDEAAALEKPYSNHGPSCY